MSEKTSPMGLNSFQFSFEQGQEAKRDLELRVEALRSRIKNISSRVVINNIPVVDQFVTALMSLEPSPEDVELVGKAIERIGKLLPELNTLNKRLAVVNASMEDQNWLVAAFADFTNDFPNDLPEDVNIEDLSRGREE